MWRFQLLRKLLPNENKGVVELIQQPPCHVYHDLQVVIYMAWGLGA